MSDFCVEEAMMDEKARLFGRIHLKTQKVVSTGGPSL
jgi:hypothetical protein